MAEDRPHIPLGQPQAHPSGFFLCHHCEQYVDLQPGAFVEIENAVLPSQARLKCPKCHKHAVQWHPPSPQGAPRALARVSDERAAELFAQIREIVAAA